MNKYIIKTIFKSLNECHLWRNVQTICRTLTINPQICWIITNQHINGYRELSLDHTIHTTTTALYKRPGPVFVRCGVNFKTCICKVVVYLHLYFNKKHHCACVGNVPV